MTEAFSFILLLIAMFFVGAGFASNKIMTEAFERGYAVECLGKQGYYWECESIDK